ncbi:hypothetical protein cypCar_00043529 [Cyprinus carpio]|nr:hypothetical protein cypCar_00043529 [Cyprinus carpio]
MFMSFSDLSSPQGKKKRRKRDKQDPSTVGLVYEGALIVLTVIAFLFLLLSGRLTSLHPLSSSSPLASFSLFLCTHAAFRSDPGSPKKCRARFGLNQQTDWCGPCRCVRLSLTHVFSSILESSSALITRFSCCFI